MTRSRPRIWTPQQLGRFVTHVRDDRYFALWLLVVTTVLRRRELAGLLMDDVDLNYGRVSPSTPRVVANGRVIESETKTSTGIRSLSLDPDTRAALAGYLSTWAHEREQLGQDTRLLFVHRSGEPLHPDWITELFHRHRKAAELPRIRLHDVRHSYPTAAMKAGVSPKIISERLGHSTVAFTLQTYAHVIPSMDEAAASLTAALILAPHDDSAADGSTFGSIEVESGQKRNWPGTKSQASGGSGGRI